MTNPARTPAGWYADPTGRHEYRYWQGESWTDAVAGSGQVSTDPPTMTLGPAVEAIPPADPAEAGNPTLVSGTTTVGGTMPAPGMDRFEDAASARPGGWEQTPPEPGGPASYVAPVWSPPTGLAVPGPHPQPGVYPPPGTPGGPGGFSAPSQFTAPGFPGTSHARSQRWWIIVAAAASVVVLTIGVTGWFVLGRPGPSPQGLAASTVTSTTISLVWSQPAQGPSPQRYVVRRNGKEVARVGPEATYRDSGLSPMTSYRYRVLALVDGDLSAPTKNVVVKTRPAAPTGVTSSNVTTTSIVISWSAPSGTTPDRYLVQRDGTRLATVPADTLTYKDSSLAPVTDVSYTIIAVIEGQESDPSTPLRATTLAPPVQNARLQGPWNVTLAVTRSGGTRLKVGAKSSESWTFTPRCSSGACPVNLSGTVAGKPFTMTLTRSGAVYRGTTKARVAKCVNADVASTLTLALRVSAGTVASGTWAVSDWTGSLDLAIPYTVSGSYYCPAQSATFKVTPDSAAAQSQT